VEVLTAHLSVMAVGKNKKLGKKKGLKKKQTDPFAKKEWYIVRAPKIFPIKEIGRTLVTKTIGSRLARDSLMGRCFDVSLGDLKPDTDVEAFRKFTLRVEDVQGNHVLTNFAGMTITSDKLRSLVRKWQTLIEAHADVRTTDGYSVRLFAIGFTRSKANNARTKAYAQTSQVKQLRKKMVETMTSIASKHDLHRLVEILMLEVIGMEIEKKSKSIYPLGTVLIRKVKVLKGPKIDATKLLDQHGGLESIPIGAPQPVIVKQVDTGSKMPADGKGKGKAKAAEKK